jgi:hypothetical protein
MIEKSSKYKFDKNLLGLSLAKDIEEAKKEWYYICNETRPSDDGLCICQHKIKHVVYLYNKTTKKAISVGSACYKKFNFDAEKMSSPTFNYVLRDAIEKGKYIMIGNVIEFSNEVKDHLIECFWRSYNNVKYMKDARWDFLNTVKSLIDEYNLEYLEAFHEEIHDDIVKLDNADEIIKLVEQAKIDLFNEVQQKRIKDEQLRREEKVKEPKKAEMRERVARLSEQLDKGIEEEANRQKGNLCSRCHLPDENGKLYKIRAPSGTLKLFRCKECSILADHWIDTKFSDRAFVL